MYVFRLITLVNVLFSNYKIPVNNGIHTVCRVLTCLVNVGKRLFSRVNCEGKLSDNGTNTCIHRQENTGKTSDYPFAKHWKMHAKYRVFGEFTIHFPNGECNVFCSVRYSRQGKLKSAIQIELIIQRSNTDTSQFGLAHTLMCIARSFGFLILWRLFLKPTHLNNKIEAQADQWYCISPSSATASVPATPLTDQFR